MARTTGSVGGTADAVLGNPRTSPTYAVTGAFGRLGRLAVAELLARGAPASDVVAVVRARGNAADLSDRGVDVREAAYDVVALESGIAVN